MVRSFMIKTSKIMTLIAIQCSPQNIDLHLERIRLLEEKKDNKRLVLAKMMLLKYINIETHLDLYNKYFNELINVTFLDIDLLKL